MKKRHIFAFLGATFLFTACNEDITQNSVPQQGDALDLYANVSQQYVTRASDGGFADKDEIGVFIVNYNNNVPQELQLTGNHANNVRFIYSEATGKWTGSYQIYWKDKQTPVDAYGYYPFDANLSSVTAYPFTIQKNQQEHLKTGRQLTGYEQSDFLWAKQEKILANGGPIILSHHHIMAGIKVILTEGEGFGEGEWDEVQKIILVENTILNGTINLQNGTVNCSGNEVGTIVPQLHENIYRAVVLPQTIAADTPLFTITIDNKNYRFTRDEAMVYQPSKLHQFTFTVNKSLETGDYEFSLTSESVTEWENDAESHNGEAREYIVVNVEEGEYLGDVIEGMGLDPKKIINLKITGCISDGNSFDYIRNRMTNLEALNLKELRTKDMRLSGSWEDSGRDYGMPETADDYIPAYAFEDMSSLRYFVFPDHLKGIGVEAFPGTSLCGSLILPEGLKYIGRGAFVAYGHKGSMMTGELYIPSTVEYIGGGAFNENDGNANQFFFTNELVLPAKMKYLGGGAFAGCLYMSGTIRVPDGITELNNAWPGQIKGPVVIPQGITKIYGIPGGAIGDIHVPEGVEEIGSYAFHATRYLRNIHLPSTLKRFERDAFSLSGVTHINIPEGIEIIETAAFYGCENLQDTLTIPSTVTQIRDGAFAYCRQLTAVILPAGLQGIQGNAFANCSSLDYIECQAIEPPAIEESTFSGAEKNNFTVVVPAGSVEAYKAAPYWCEFKRISSDSKFVCRPMQAKLLNKGHVRDVVLNAPSGVDWSISSKPDWVTVMPLSGTGKTELKITIADMSHNQGDREGAVTFLLDRNDDEGNPITCTYTVKQFDYEIEEDAVLTLQTATQGQRGGIDIIFVGDGYDAEDIAKGTYRTDMEQEMEYFFAVEPYKTYKNYFNVSAAMAMSMESGVLDSPDKWRNTKFNITYGADGDGRLSVPFSNIAAYVLQDIRQSPVTAENIGRSLIICVPNSSAYEGLTAIYSDGSAIAVCPMSKLDYPNDARGLIQHEAGGHGWAKLDDEYVYHRDNIHTCTCPCCGHTESVQAMHAMGWGRNLSLNSRYGQVEWKHLISHPQYSDIVDIYEGGHMHAQGIYRSEINSCMNNNVPYFSTWSRQLIVERIKEAAGETFSFDDFVQNDSRAYGNKFLLAPRRAPNEQHMEAMHSHNHAPVIIKGSPMDFLKKKGGKR